MKKNTSSIYLGLAFFGAWLLGCTPKQSSSTERAEVYYENAAKRTTIAGRQGGQSAINFSMKLINPSSDNLFIDNVLFNGESLDPILKVDQKTASFLPKNDEGMLYFGIVQGVVEPEKEEEKVRSREETNTLEPRTLTQAEIDGITTSRPYAYPDSVLKQSEGSPTIVYRKGKDGTQRFFLQVTSVSELDPLTTP